MALSKSLVYAALVALAAADFGSDASAVESNAQSLSSQIAGWSSGDGLPGALGIQGGFPSLVAAVNALSGDAGSLTGSSVDTTVVNSLSAAVVDLLSALTAKAADFTSVGALQIVQGDIKSLQPAAVDILGSIVAAVSGDDAKISALLPALSSYTSGFDAADEAYSIDKASWPAIPTGGAAPSSSAAESSAPAATTAAESSAAAETSAAASATITSAPFGNSTNGTVTATSTKLETITSCSGGCTQTAIANNAAGIAVGAGAAVLGAAALLI